MKIAIVGSRSFNDYDLLKESILSKVRIEEIDMMVSGGADGADSLGELFAKLNNIPTKIYRPNWNKYGKKAGIIRNEYIIEYSDIIFAFWDGESKGTKNSIDIAQRKGKELNIIVFTNDGTIDLKKFQKYLDN
jgi:hypothetical protein